MKRCRIFRATAVILAFGAALMGDQVTLKNGDRLSGQIVKFEGEKLTLKSEFFGSVNIPWTATDTIVSTEPLYLTLIGGQVVVGTVSSVDGRVQVNTSEAGTITTARDRIKTIRSKDEEALYQTEIDRLRNPRLLDLWSGILDTGLSLTRGNSVTTAYTLAMKAARTSTRDKISVYLTSLYAKNKATGVSVVTANAIRGGIRYDLNISDKNFAFGFTDLEFDKFQRLDLRAVLGGGLGRHAIKSETTQLDFFAGGSLNKEFFSTGLNRTSGEALVGNDLTYKLSTAIQIRQTLTIFPNVSEGGQFRVAFDTSAVTNLNKWLGWQISLSDRYLSNPIPGIKKNDLLLTTGLRLTFSR